MTESLDDLSEYEHLLLKMEDLLEHRIEIDQKACAGSETDWKELYDGECESCGRTYEAVYLVDFDYQTDPHQLEPEKGDCIPCWRKKHDLPKVDRDTPEVPIE